MAPLAKTLTAAALVAALVGILPAAAEEPSPRPAKPRLALVLSGGGARGAAHVGVLKVLEELHVPVNFVAGTSMGAIVGGLYASGMSPAEMERVLVTTDWDALFDDSVPREQLSFRRKRDQDGTLTKLTIGIEKAHPSLPSGLVSGQKLNFLLRKLTLPVATVTDFDKLPIPYRTVATDIATGRKVVFGSGMLPEAIRASMAFPGLFAPVDIAGLRLVDGGVAENLPVEEALASGAERILAIDIGTPLKRKEELETFLGILNQTTGLVTSRNVENSREKLRPWDLLIEPPLGDISFADFWRMKAALDIGEAAARAKASELSSFAVPDAEWAAYIECLRFPKGPPPEIVRIELDNSSPVADAILMAKIRSRPGPLDLDVLRKDLDRIYATGEMQIVDWRLLPGPDGNTLQIVAKDKAWGQTTLRLGLNLSTNFQGESAFSFLLKAQRTAVNDLGAEWRIVFGAGEKTIIAADWYQPLSSKGTFFLSPSALYGVEAIPIRWLDRGVILDYHKRVLRASLDLGAVPSRSWEVRAGIFRGRESGDITSEDFPSESFGTGGFAFRIAHDRLDNVVVPTKGTAGTLVFTMSLPEIGAGYRWNKLEGEGTAVGTIGRSTFQVTAKGGTALGSNINSMPITDYFALGGLYLLSGWKAGELFGPYMAFGQLGYRYRIGKLPALLGGGLYTGISLELGNVWHSTDTVDFTTMHPAGAVYIAGDTPLGPVNLGVGVAEQGRYSIYLQLGKVF